MKAHCEAAAADEGINRYEWALNQDNWFELIRYSPHLHMEVYGPLMNSEEFYKKTGWTYTNHDDGVASGRSGVELRKTLYYLLTHAWVKDNHKVVRYWAGLSTHNLRCVDMGFELRSEPCPVCQCDCVRTPPDIVWADGSIHPYYQDLDYAPVFTQKVRLYQYTIRRRKKCRLKISAKALRVWGSAGPPVGAT
jgi:hypothetical protein